MPHFRQAIPERQAISAAEDDQPIPCLHALQGFHWPHPERLALQAQRRQPLHFLELNLDPQYVAQPLQCVSRIRSPCQVNHIRIRPNDRLCPRPAALLVSDHLHFVDHHDLDR